MAMIIHLWSLRREREPSSYLQLLSTHIWVHICRRASASNNSKHFCAASHLRSSIPIPRRKLAPMNKATIFELAKGFRGRAKNCIRAARPRVEKALQYAYRDRRNKKRDMRQWSIERINAGARQYGVRGSDSRFLISECG